ncbi:MAG: cytochrome c [Bosea sp. (in: a-proteobacteria)]|uniref:c-type cytochrome n=1 Tax=Bosea sp. (in: a-proteobacteria) TaxID=1871050 RepID=UPI002733F18D|nr:c-type cytochrome [Bosea sp. (in: a-proteobacteria)]MDP3254483.1 cytochrome c [Bosea sp. (in: a-proteobacteria)]MDP3318455.1 cytochrome c [Bosea sp. (in: a-proteobacteria)]
MTFRTSTGRIATWRSRRSSTSRSPAAQEPGDARAGRTVATTLCLPCHAIDGASRDPARVPPDFGAVADMPSQTALSLRVFLQTPHGDMPRYRLTATETDDVIAYVLSLRAR